MGDNKVEISAELIHESKYAYCIFDGTQRDDKTDKHTWIPKSLVKRDGDNVFILPEWLAIDKGFI